MNLLADSAAWLALYDRGDKYHARAQRAFRELAERKVNFIVTDYLVAESITLIRGRAGHATAATCGGWLLNSPHVHVIRAGHQLVGCGLAIAQTLRRQGVLFRGLPEFRRHAPRAPR